MADDKFMGPIGLDDSGRLFGRGRRHRSVGDDPHHSFQNRARGAMLGLALGDAYGRTLEFISDDAVRTRPVSITTEAFVWTDDTHMAMYLANAILELGDGPLDDDAFGHAVGRKFAQWREDPLTPSTAPGGTCLRGAAAYAHRPDWRSSGDPNSDGCGAPMRVTPVALAFEGDELVRAAGISAVVTHGHPNAVEATVALAWLIRTAAVEQRLDAEVVAECAERLRGPWSSGGEVADALDAAIAQAARAELEWLDEPAIPTGDGGWRSASAVGLAVCAALRWGEDFETAIVKATRIRGDSDSVGAIAGTLLGARGGTWVLPQAWVDVIRGREELIDLADALADRGWPA